MTPNSGPPVDEATWRNRFIMVNLTRIGGTIIALMGLVIWQGDWPREGGWTAVGFPLALIGLAISFLGPLHLAKKWRTPPGQ
jgi:hypothetical protein